MTLVALGLILTAAAAHAAWNLLAKRAGDAGAPFVWLVGACSVLLYMPLAAGVLLVADVPFGPLEATFLTGSGILQLVYFLTLQRGYAVGDLSVVYPLARGTGPLLAAAGAVLLLGERPTPIGVAGLLSVSGGVLLLASRRSGNGTRSALAWGATTGVVIACYTLWDAYAVAVLVIPPLLLSWTSDVVRSVLLAPAVLGDRRRLRLVWRTHRARVLGVAVLAPAAYILVLTAFTLAPVSYIAPAREISILLGTLLGAQVLAEGHTAKRGIAAATIAVGLVLLTLG